MASIFWSIVGNRRNRNIPPDGIYQVTAVADGDTFSILVDGKQEICRLSGIDTPELSQQMGKVCRAYLISQILDTSVRLVFLKRGKYKRLICHVFLGLQLLQVRMIMKGFGYVYAKYVDSKYKQQFEEAELFAYRHRLGVHANNLAVRPWDYRSNLYN